MSESMTMCEKLARAICWAEAQRFGDCERACLALNGCAAVPSSGVYQCVDAILATLAEPTDEMALALGECARRWGIDPGVLADCWYRMLKAASESKDLQHNAAGGAG